MKTIEGIGFKFCYDEMLYSVEVRGLFDLLLLVLKIYRSEKGVLVQSGTSGQPRERSLGTLPGPTHHG